MWLWLQDRLWSVHAVGHQHVQLTSQTRKKSERPISNQPIIKPHCVSRSSVTSKLCESIVTAWRIRLLNAFKEEWHRILPQLHHHSWRACLRGPGAWYSKFCIMLVSWWLAHWSEKTLTEPHRSTPLAEMHQCIYKTKNNMKSCRTQHIYCTKFTSIYWQCKDLTQKRVGLFSSSAAALLCADRDWQQPQL